MVVKVVGVLIGTFLLLLQNANGQSCVCKCGPTGLFGEDDLCSKPAPSGPLVVRPKSLIKPVSLPLFGSSIKGPCFRRQAIVKPAVVPRPVYLQSEAHTQTGDENAKLASAVAAAAQILSQSSGSSQHSNAHSLTQDLYHAASAISGSGYQGVHGIDVSKAYEQACTGLKPSAPADAVSLAIAYKQSQNNYNKKIAEDRLTYGFRKLPIEIPAPKQKIYKNILPEQSLYTLNGQIVELKPVSEQGSCDSLAEEAEEELLDLALSEEANDVHVARRPSLDELGYAPAKISSATFVDIPAVPSMPAPAPLPPVAVCNDGFKSGTVEYKDFAKQEADAPAAAEDVSCEEQEEAVKHIPIPAPSCQCNYNGNVAGLVHSYARSSKASSSASSSSSHSQKRVVLEKLCS